MNLAHEINDSLTQLCRHYFPNNEALVSKHLRHSVTMINSPVFTPANEDELKVISKIKRRLVKNNKTTEAVRFSELCQQLSTKKSVTRRSDLLHFLFSLNQSANHTNETRNVVPELNLSPALMNHHHQNGQPAPLWPLPPPQFDNACTSSGVSSVNSPVCSSSGNVQRLSSVKSRISARNAYDTSCVHVSERELLRDVIYCLQCIDGKFVKFDEKTDDFYFNPTDNIPKPTKELIRKIVECGWLFSKINKACAYLNEAVRKCSFSLALTSAVQIELSDYYRTLALFQAQLEQPEDQGVNAVASSCGLTLRRVYASLLVPKQKLQLLASILDTCKDAKGGALISVLNAYRKTGDADSNQVVSNLLSSTCRPMLTLILRWMFEGYLEDVYDEFFIVCNQSAREENMWTEKYSVNFALCPDFLNKSVANQILIAGKSLNFLRSVCKDRTFFPQLELKRKAFKDINPEFLFDNSKRDEFRELVEFVYMEISRHLLNTLNNTFYLYSNILALKKYILLSQGDFARCLLDNLHDDLSKPVTEIQLHNLTGHLESAIRQTNAQFENRQIVDRLDVALLEKTDGDTGWEIFVLKFWNTGPISTVLTQESLRSYNRLFDFVWRLKRLSFMYSDVWRENVSLKSAKKISNLASVVHGFYLATCEIVFFIDQMQYYFLFEVLECAWADLEAALNKANDMDEVIVAHNKYVQLLLNRALLSGEFPRLLDDFRTLVELLFRFETLHSSFFLQYRKEVEMRENFLKTCRTKTKKSEWALNDETEEAEATRQQQVVATLTNKFKPALNVLLEQYRRSLSNFLTDLKNQEQDSFRLLSFRLDFSQFYSSQDPQLDTPLTFRRLSRRQKKIDDLLS